jgi:hypothetical protein
MDCSRIQSWIDVYRNKQYCNPNNLSLGRSPMLICSNDQRYGSLGEAWINLVQMTVQNGSPLNGECLELLEAKVSFPAMTDGDELIRQFGDGRMMAEMENVFFADGANALGHSYANLMRGPGGRHDLEDIISLLRAEPASKRAVVTLCGLGDGKVPCINVHSIPGSRQAPSHHLFRPRPGCLQKILCRCALPGENGASRGGCIGSAGRCRVGIHRFEPRLSRGPARH